MKRFSLTTKVSSRQTSRKTRLRNLVLLGLLVGVLWFSLTKFVGTVASFVFAPVTQIETWFMNSSSILPNYFGDRQLLVERIDKLERQLASESGTTNTIKRLQKENNELRRLLGEESNARIAAGVIGRPAATPYDVLILDKGKNDGIVKSAPVYVGVDQAIGYVAEVYQNTSVVALVSTPGFESTVYILGPNIYTNARGIGGGVLEVSVPQGIPIVTGDLVVVPSFDSGVYGSIDVVNSVPTEPEQRGYVTLNVSMQSLRFVSIGRTPLTSFSFEEAKTVIEKTKRDLTKIPVPEGVLVDIDTATGTATVTPETHSETLEVVTESE